MASYTRKNVGAIINDENLTADEKTERLFALYGQALDEGYVSKSAADAAKNAAIEAARADALKNVEKPNILETEEYKKLAGDFDAYKAMQKARSSEEFANVKGKFFETVYGMVDRNEGAKPVADQLTEIAEKYEEYFNKTEEQPKTPQFGGPTHGGTPSGKTGPSFMDTWGFVPPKS